MSFEAPTLEPATTETSTETSTKRAAESKYTRSHQQTGEVTIHSQGQTTWQHTLAMTSAVFFPFAGVIGAIAWCWAYGWMGWGYLAMMVGGWLLTGMGITIGFHRLLTHRSFETYRWLKVIWTALGSLAIEGSPLVWVAMHRKHHRLSDKHGDPHSPCLHGDGWWNALRGFWHAHTGWLYSDQWTRTDLNTYVPDMMADPLQVKIDRYYYLWVIASFTGPALVAGLVTMSWQGALLGFIWGSLVRIFVTHHITWSINSICHMFGSREFESADDSRNNLLFGLLGHGEGWHNNHHAFPTSARHGLRWWQVDTSWLVIRAMQRLGLVWDVRLPTPRQMEAKLLEGSR